MQAMTPVAASERIEFLDVLRGAALFGILTSNMRAFNGPLAAYFDHSLMWTGTVDKIVQGFIDLFVTGKFITLFAFLFGIGFAMQMDRSAARGVDPRNFYRRRLTVLLAFGLVHMFFIWWGDILAPYALVGFVLFLFRNSSRKKILVCAAIAFWWPMILSGLMTVAQMMGAKIPMPPPATQVELQRVIQVYSTGSYADILQQHLKEIAFSGMGLIFYYPRVLGLFLIGLAVWRAGIIGTLVERTESLRRWALIGFTVGLLGNGLVVALREIYHPDPMAPSLLNLLIGTADSIGVPALSLGYASTLALLFLRPEWRSRLHPFGAIGRMALTNYLLQSVICSMIFNSYGLGLYGTMNPLTGLGLTVLIYGLQVPFSVWWLRRYEYGPMEWLWRKLTYGVMRPAAAPEAAAGA
jgi:uncharacterized protein